MGSYVELNYVLQITSEQGFPKELAYQAHLKKPFIANDFEGKVFEFRNKEKVRIYQLPPVHVFLAHNVDGKWLYWGQVEILEIVHDNVKQTTSGKFTLKKIYSPEQMRWAQEIITADDWGDIQYFNSTQMYNKKTEERIFSDENSLRMNYKNWKGETSIRTIKPITVWFGTTEFHKGNHWFLKAFDLEKQAERDYAMEDIIEIYPADNSNEKDKLL